MVLRAGRRRPAPLRSGLLLFVLLFSTAAAVRPSSWEAEYRRARDLNLHEGGPPAALQVVEAALARAGDSEDPWVIMLRLYRAELRAQTGKSTFPEAVTILEKPLPPHLRKTEIEIRRRNALAMVLYYAKQQETAKSILDETVALASKDIPAFAMDAYYARGNLNQNEDDIRTAMRLAKAAGDETWALMSEALLVRTFEGRGGYGEAVRIGERLLPLLRAAKLRVAITIQGNVGSSYFWLGDYESSKECFLRAEAAAREIKSTAERIIWLDRLGDTYLAFNDLNGAEQSYGEAATLARPIRHRQFPRALSNLAQIAIRRRQFEKARSLIDEAILLDRKSRDDEDVLRARVIRGELHLAAGKYDAARKELEEVAAATKTVAWRLQAETALARMYAVQSKRKLADRYFVQAVETAARQRDRITEDYRFTFFNSVEDLFDTYVDFLVEGREREKALVVTEESRARTLAEGLGGTTSKKKPDPVALAKRANATILAYWLGSRRSYVWTVTASGISIHPLPPAAEIERDVDEYRKVLRNGSLTESAARGQRLFQTLITPAVRSSARDSRIIVIADGKLHQLNFETLVVPAPRPRWWIVDVVVTSANSLQLLGRPPLKRTAEPELLLVGNAPQADPAFPPLPKAGLEMQEVGAHFARRKVLSGAAATPQAFRQAGPAAYDVIHFVAHGIATRRQPLDSAVILAKDSTDGYKLFARDIVKQNLTAELVTISSCHGAGMRAYAGEGLVGLAWAFLRAGAGQVIAALWEVDDAATVKLMDHMYARIRSGRDPAAALREAKRALIRSGTSHQKPRYWAPFVIYAGS